MLDVSILRAMAAAGASQEAIFAAIEAEQKLNAEVRAAKREKDRIRKRNQRSRPQDSVEIAGHRGTDGTTPSSPSPPSSSPLTLSLITTPSSSPSPSASLRSAAARKLAARLAEDWKPSSTDIEFALSKGLSMSRITTEGEKFRNYWIAKSGKDATKADWPATWRNWILNAVEREGKQNGKRTVQEAASDLVERVRGFDAPAPTGIRDGTGETNVRLLPAR